MNTTGCGLTKKRIIEMQCPFCNHGETKVIDKRDHEGITKRRRECLKCEKRFNTLESVEKLDLRVIKKDGGREDYDLEKMKRGIIKACEKRPITQEQINKMVNNISYPWSNGKVKSEVIGELVSRELKKVDKVAYIRFASVYREFRDISDFKKEIKELAG